MHGQNAVVDTIYSLRGKPSEDTVQCGKNWAILTTKYCGINCDALESAALGGFYDVCRTLQMYGFPITQEFMDDPLVYDYAQQSLRRRAENGEFNVVRCILRLFQSPLRLSEYISHMPINRQKAIVIMAAASKGHLRVISRLLDLKVSPCEDGDEARGCLTLGLIGTVGSMQPDVVKVILAQESGQAAPQCHLPIYFRVLTHWMPEFKGYIDFSVPTVPIGTSATIGTTAISLALERFQAKEHASMVLPKEKLEMVFGDRESHDQAFMDPMTGEKKEAETTKAVKKWLRERC